MILIIFYKAIGVALTHRLIRQQMDGQQPDMHEGGLFSSRQRNNGMTSQGSNAFGDWTKIAWLGFMKRFYRGFMKGFYDGVL
jgi:hypothetical protein